MIPRFEEAHMALEQKVAAIVKTEKTDEPEEPEKTPTDVNYLKGQKGIPDFWQRAMKSNRLIWDKVKEKDEEIMKHLRHIESASSENPDSKNMQLTLTMVFDENNDFFKPSTLKVMMEYASEDSLKEIKGTNIEWMEGKDPTKKKIKKK